MPAQANIFDKFGHMYSAIFTDTFWLIKESETQLSVSTPLQELM